MEFEAEEMERLTLECMKGKTYQPPPAPVHLVPQGPPATELVQQTGTTSHFNTPTMQRQGGPQDPQWTDWNSVPSREYSFLSANICK